MAARKRMVIIDGKSIFYRGYYAMPNLSMKDGTPTGGVFGFTALSLEVIKRLKPDYVAVAWDKPKTNIRKRLQIYPQYKAGRKPAPDDFYAQIPILYELLNALGWPLYELDDYEADDIMAGLAKKADDNNLETYLVTSDMDMLQCISEHTKVYILKKGLSNIEEFHPESFKDKYGLEPEQFVDLKALQGDSSDNIPGVPGVGIKTATGLLQKYETLDGVYNNVELVPGKVHDKLVAGKNSAYMSHKLATMFYDAPIDLDLHAMDVKKFNAPELKGMLEKLEFKSLLRQLPELADVESTHVTDTVKLPNYKLVSIDDFEWPKLDLRKTQHSLEPAHSPTASLSSFGVATATPPSDKTSSRTTEQDSMQALGSRKSSKDVLTVLGFIKDAHSTKAHAILVANNTQVSVITNPDKTISKYKANFESVNLTGYAVKKVVSYLLHNGISAAVSHDIKVAAFIINSLNKRLELSELASSELGADIPELSDIPPEDISNYAVELAGVLTTLTVEQQKTLKNTGRLQQVAATMDWPVIPVLSKMELTGIKLNKDYLQTMSRELEDALSDIEQEIYGHAEQEFNISSPQQLADILFEVIGLPTHGIKKGKTGYSTAASELNKLRGYHPIINLISQYRELSKLKSTYVDALPKQADADNRVHTTFKLTVVQTGRLSSSDPNLQNIPVRSEMGKKIRNAFVAGQGKSFVSADYSQFELRLVAIMAGDTDMIEAFNNGADIHVRTAAEVYGIALDDVTPEMRANAKTINFGVLYGMSPHGLSAATGMTISDAKEFIDKYFAARQPLVDYIAKLKKQAKEQGYVETLLGRRRPTPDVRSSNFIVRNAAERQAVNMPIQGTEADLMKLAMIKLDGLLPGGAKQILQIHDSIMVELPDNLVDEVSELMKNTMENIYPGLGINLKVDVKTGKTWATA